MPELLTVHEVAEILKVSYETSLQYVKQNHLTIKVGRQYRVSKELLNKHLCKQLIDPIKLRQGR